MQQHLNYPAIHLMVTVLSFITSIQRASIENYYSDAKAEVDATYCVNPAF